MITIRTVQQGFPGAPGYTDFHFATLGTDSVLTDVDAEACRAKVTTFWQAVKTLFPPTWSHMQETSVREVMATTGQLIALHTVSTRAPEVGAGSGTYAAPSGGLIQWRTSSVGTTGFMRGRTFLVPLMSSAYDTLGHISAAAILQLGGAARALFVPVSPSGAQLVIWRRPKNGTGGLYSAVTSADCSPNVCVLTSRRD